jgi:16S rRNA C1402 (ribose-2'-O) methylase RsmI
VSGTYLKNNRGINPPKNNEFDQRNQIFIFRELTKLHEETLAGPIDELSARLDQPQGEFTVVIPALPRSQSEAISLDKDQIQKEFYQMNQKFNRPVIKNWFPIGS